MDVRSLQAFLQAAETLHFGRAADACHVSPSTLSRTIKQLEGTLGAPLFARDNRSVALTPEGELFRRYARESLALWSAFQDSLMDETRELTGEIAMYCSVTASYSFLFDLLSAFRERHPRIRIRLQTGDPDRAVEQVRSGAAQLSIGARPAALPTTMAFRSITSTPLVFIAPQDDHGLRALAGNPADRKAWERTRMIVPQGGVARERIDRWFRERGIAPRIWAQVAGNEAIVSMVSLGDGVGVVPRIVLDNSPLARRVRVLDVQPALAPLEVGLFVLRKSLSSRPIGALWQTLR